MSQDFYKTLGVEKNATQSEIKKAFRKLAQQHHPDKGGDEAKFKEINEAYQTLSDEKKRAQYDQFGSAGPGAGFGGFGGFNQGNVHVDFDGIDLEDILSQFGMGGFGFGGRRQRKGANIQLHVQLTFKEAILGTEKEVTLPTFGKDGKQNGTQKYKLDIPAGIESGQKMKLRGYGKPFEGGEAGDAILQFVVEQHKTLRREGQHLITELEVKLTDAILGAKYEVETLEGKVGLTIPAGIQHGQLLRMKGKGVPAGGFVGTGDLVIVPKIVIPKKLSKKAKKAIKELQNEGV